MKPIRAPTCTPLLLSLSLFVLPAMADDDCDAPVRQWQSREAVMQMAARQGWQVRRLKIDDGCYEIRGLDAEGQRFKARIDPRTLDVLKLKRRDDDDEPERERRRLRGQDRPAPEAAPGDAPAPAAGGSRGQIE